MCNNSILLFATDAVNTLSKISTVPSWLYIAILLAVMTAFETNSHFCTLKYLALLKTPNLVKAILQSSMLIFWFTINPASGYASG